MDISNIASLASSRALLETNQAVGIAVLKKAINIEASSALALVEAIPQAQSVDPNLGNSVDVTA